MAAGRLIQIRNRQIRNNVCVKAFVAARLAAGGDNAKISEKTRS
jgi:hypothetical protein